MTGIWRNFPIAPYLSAQWRLLQEGRDFPPAGSSANVGADLGRPDDFYHGDLARELAAAMKKGGGLITVEDLAGYEVKEREPVRGTYRGYEIISAPPPSSGGTVLIESLNMLEGYDLAKMESRSSESVHFTVEAFRRAFFDRAEFMGDPDFAKIPVAQLLDKKYAAAWRESIDPGHAARVRS